MSVQSWETLHTGGINALSYIPASGDIHRSQPFHPGIRPSTRRNLWMPTKQRSFCKMLDSGTAKTRNITTIPIWQLDEITMGWHKAQEATSSAPSALHFGHYMASTVNPTIAIFNAQLPNLRFTTDYLLKRWTTGLNVMLEKQARNFNIEKLCIRGL